MNEALSSNTPDLDVQKELNAPVDDCAVAAIYDPEGTAFYYMYYSLENMINRGRDSSGISALNPDFDIITQKGLGTPEKVEFIPFNTNMTIGHDRYTTQSETNAKNAQPTQVQSGEWQMAFAHNGNVDVSFREKLKDQPDGNSDSAFMAQLIVESEGDTWTTKIRNAAEHFNGSYSATMLTPDGLFGFTDPRKNRPLWLGWNEYGLKTIVSETYPLEHGAFKEANMQFRPIGPGELVHIDLNGNITSEQMLVPLDEAMCLLETIYLQKGESRSSAEGQPQNNMLRRKSGQMLAREERHLRDINPEKIAVVSIPNGGNMAAEGYAEELKATQFSLLHKILDDRSFMAKRGEHVELAQRKMALDTGVITQMIESDISDIVLIDDSLIRGSQSRPTMQMIKEGLMRYEDLFKDCVGKIPNIHVRLASPQFLHPCGLGISINSHEELFYNKIENPEEYLGVDSIQHLSLPGILEAFTGQKLHDIVGQIPIAMGYCLSCVNPQEEWQNPKDWYLETERSGNIFSSRKHRDSILMSSHHG